MNRTLTITLQPDWRTTLRGAAVAAKSALAARPGRAYQGEVLNFESPGVFFMQLSERRWALVRALQGAGVLGVRELARRVGRDVKRVHEDVQVLAGLGLVERGEGGSVLCPYTDIHIDMHLSPAVLQAA